MSKSVSSQTWLETQNIVWRFDINFLADHKDDVLLQETSAHNYLSKKSCTDSLKKGDILEF